MIGQLRTRLGLYEPNLAADAIGGASITWHFKQLVWAAIEPRNAVQRQENGRLSTVQNYRVTIRYDANFPERARLKWGERMLRVIAASDPDTRGERLHLICEEEQQ